MATIRAIGVFFALCESALGATYFENDFGWDRARRCDDGYGYYPVNLENQFDQLGFPCREYSSSQYVSASSSVNGIRKRWVCSAEWGGIRAILCELGGVSLATVRLKNETNVDTRA